ncbi:MAG: DMT family transporter [Candidatus Paceibacterota bacterium]|jgi:drug/metabolite transporter (DMT)-like permease
MSAASRRYAGELFLVLSALSFSFEWYFIRVLANNGFSTFDIVFGRAFGSLLIMICCLPFFYTRIVSSKEKIRKNYIFIFVLGCIAMLSNTLYNIALQLTTVANTQVILYLCVFWGILFGSLFLKEKSSHKKVIYTGIAFLGICAAILKNDAGIAISLGIGELFALVVSFLLSMDAIISRKIRQVSIFARMLLIYTVMVLLSFIIIFYLHGIAYFYNFLSYPFLMYSLALAMTSGILGKGLTYLGINYVPASIALVLMLLEPIAQIMTAYLIADEKLSLLNMCGIFVVFAMVILISKKKTGAMASV